MNEHVYVWTHLKGPDGGPFRQHLLAHRPFAFDPYEVLTLAEYVESKAWLDEYPEDFKLISEKEYLAWKAEKEADAAELRYCGDFGGTKASGAFCGKKVHADGERCEHHGGNDEELQGTYERVDIPRPKGLK